MKRTLKLKNGLAKGLLFSTVILFSQCQKEQNDLVPEVTVNSISAVSSQTFSLDVAAASSKGGYSYVIYKDFKTPGDTDAKKTQSILKIYENGKELGPAHSLHRDVKISGKGRFSHWGNELYFSASDNTNPRTNGRKYTYSVGSIASEPTPTPTPTPAPTPSQPLSLNVSDASSMGGYSYVIYEDFKTPGDSESKRTQSILKIYENGKELGPAHSLHRDVKNLGKGRFSHWGNELYFSASDNTNPHTNGRKYTYTIGSATGTPTPIPTPTPVPTPTPTPSTGIIGYANVDGKTTGGQGGQTVTVTSLSALKSAASSSSPMIIQISGTITGTGSVTLKSNKTIVGLKGAVMNGVGFKIFNISNVIIQNLKIQNVVAGTDDNDCVNIKNSHHIWIDHCEMSASKMSNWDYYDGLIDITKGSDYITVSWNKLHDTNKAILIGGGDGTTSDRGHLRVTLYKNYLYNIAERQPRIRFGNVHVFNNYIKNGSGYGVAVAMGGTVRTDNNYFEGTNAPLKTDVGGTAGYVSGASTNIFKSCGANRITSSASTWLPPYSYNSEVIAAANVPSVIMNGVGPK
ncbi:pectate lyase family protein [Desertivirga xinjiangensis]|uniref:pectate lyase family protein n=1 Tax=Desertivirga xinjiangensis TaxID=539206 RepID=UPI00210A30B7|nr:pectate lyase [Pedobacter xinjiangensis]